VIPGAFEYHRPASVDDVISPMAQFGDEGGVVAGGHSLIPMMKLRLAEPAHLIDLGAATPQEIAPSILAEIVQQRRHPARPAVAPSVQSGTIDGGSYQSRIVTQLPGDCQGTEGKH
jgi:hypothetical protein